MREFPVPSSQFPVELRAWFRELLNLVFRMTGDRADHSRRSRLADTTDDGMIEMLARAIVRTGTRWERAAVRATIGLHATRLRDDGASGEQGLMQFKEILQHAMPPISVRNAEQSRVAKDMVRWWVEAYYERDA
jgi:hypothetical protein